MALSVLRNLEAEERLKIVVIGNVSAPTAVSVPIDIWIR